MIANASVRDNQRVSVPAPRLAGMFKKAGCPSQEHPAHAASLVKAWR